MKKLLLSLTLVLGTPLATLAAPGDQWILGIHHIDNQGDKPFTAYAGAGYSGPQSSGAAQYVGNAYGYASTGAVGVNRVYWELSGNAINDGDPIPTTTELYRVEFYGTTEAGHNDWQPVESQLHGIVGEEYPIESSIPWAGQFGTNHQWIANPGADDGAWHVLGPGPQADSNPPADGTMLWLTSGSWLYAKWDFGNGINRSWSALRLTQIAPLPPPKVSGDYNKNGVVDAADYVVWRQTLDQFGLNLAADGDDSGYVDDADYSYWRNRFGKTSGSGTGASVPEPSTQFFAGFAAVASCLVRIRQRSVA